MPPASSNKPRQTFWQKALPILSSEPFFWLIAGLAVLKSALLFYGSLQLQTEHVELWFSPEKFRSLVEGTERARWSAPLDDVFIHFDFARATARGYPFEWIEGNGYSSGGTSLLYPFVLAPGFFLGFQGLALAHYSAIVACVSTFAVLLGARRMFCRLPAIAALIAPFALLAVGALNWTLFSGMEVAVFLAVWTLTFVLWDDLMDEIALGTASRAGALRLGAAAALLVSCRPEAAPLVAVLGFSCAIKGYRRNPSRLGFISELVFIGAPGALVLLLHMAANKLLTGDSAAAGALAKLEMHHPYLTSSQAFESWVFYLKYQFLRLSDYHFSAYPVLGYIVWPLALLSVIHEKTRRTGLLLWVSIVLWIAVVALNGQVRWQNERYTMPAVAWLLLAAALGIGASLHWALTPAHSTWRKAATTAALVLACAAFTYGQAPRMRDQVWFFGRASRNILEQHVRAGQFLRASDHHFRRVLLSDAGAIPYESDLPAFDLIGLGGYGGLPIAKASRQGVGAAVELLGHVPLSDLPDVMALYPSWWGDFVLWFGKRRGDFPVRGNVICGGASKVIYSPDWTPLAHSDEPIELGPGERVIGELDAADILSEEAHHATWNRPDQGYVNMKLLPDPRDRHRDLWDAGRLISTNMELRFSFQATTKHDTALLVRVAPSERAQLELFAGSQALGKIQLEPSDSWQEIRMPIPAGTAQNALRLWVTQGQVHIYHVFVVASGPLKTGSPAATPELSPAAPSPAAPSHATPSPP